MPAFTPYHSQYLAHLLTLEGVSEAAIAQSLSTARVDMNPHQVDAALFALSSPLSKGAMLADEVGLGKTIEAAIVIAQRWAERRRRILLVVPASLRKQWAQELQEKFSLPSVILEARSYTAAVKAGTVRPFDRADAIIITSYEFAARRAVDVRAVAWDLVIFDEAHRLRNVWRGAASQRAQALKTATAGRFKLLLTATPLQNSLMELYGLVSVIDDEFFGDEASFRETYVLGKGAANLPILRKRLAHICRRTLRRQVQLAGLINYTNRHARTFQFEASDDELELYKRVSDYLQTKGTLAFGDKPNGLITLVFRKILGSSTFAVVDTLRKVLARLEAKQSPDLKTVDDIDDVEVIAEEIDDLGLGGGETINPVQLAAEIASLRNTIALAERIGTNEKGNALLRALPQVFDEIESKGGQRKAVIFTESVRTQRYLADLLTEAGYGGRIALMNGNNSDASSQEIYKAWLIKHRGTDAVSGSRSADMKAAVVEAFRDDHDILIATESGAEGINLQFCSLLVNYDLPWNPQRVEQRIGRCHRYGQRIDVTIVNFLNLKNQAEVRVHQLLEQKFNLFEGVFGASDEVLGAIESGVDIERRILEIVQSSRTSTEIDAGFDALQAELSIEIDVQLTDARSKLLETVDDTVVSRLKARKGELDRRLSSFDERLMRVARAELPDAVFPADDAGRFDWQGKSWCTDWPRAGDRDWQFFRLSEGTLAADLVARAKARNLPSVTLTMSISDRGGGRLLDLEPYVGRGGWLSVSKLHLGMADAVTEVMLLSGVTDDGKAVDAETCDRLFTLPASMAGTGGSGAPGELDQIRDTLVARHRAEAEARNANWLEEESDKLDAYAGDLEAAAEIDAKALAVEIKAAKKALRLATDMGMEEKLAERRRINKLDGRLQELKFKAFERQREIRAQVDTMLEDAQTRLRLAPAVTPLFTVRWQLAA